MWAITNQCLLLHGDYTIVDPPEPELVPGDKITERDGVWVSKGGYFRALVANSVVVVVVDDALSANRDESGLRWMFVSTDPADLIPAEWRK